VAAVSLKNEDIDALVRFFAEQLSVSAGVPFREFHEDAIARLKQRSWPGNIRELRNAVERALILASGKTVTAADIERLMPATGGARGAGVFDDLIHGLRSFDTFKQDSERTFLEAKLKEHGWNVSETARALDMPRSNLYKKIERYGLARE
jgi:two-component system nitrogen regulation response regulator NtrX